MPAKSFWGAISRKETWGEKRRYKEAEKPITKATGMPATSRETKMSVIKVSDMEPSRKHT